MKRIITIISILVISTTAFGATVDTSQKIHSNIMGQDIKYSVYLPDGYETGNKKYPVFYLLHGLGDDHTSWSKNGKIADIANAEISEGRAAEMIIIMPDGKDYWYINSHDGAIRYEDMFFEELIPHIDATYRTYAQKQYRAIGGLSMGGQGALLYSVKHPEMFVACGAMSSGVFTDEDFANGAGVFPTLFNRLFGTESPNKYWAQNSVLGLMQTMPVSQKKAVKFLIDCGDDDFLYRGNSMLHIIMRDKKIPHEFRIRNGGHSWEYWRTGIVDILGFITEAFPKAK